MFNILNRKEIRKALFEYKECEKQRKLVLEDQEIQKLYEQEKIEEARELINQRYPMISMTKEKGINLVKVMTNNIEEYKDIKPEDIYFKVKIFNKFIELAEQV